MTAGTANDWSDFGADGRIRHAAALRSVASIVEATPHPIKGIARGFAKDLRRAALKIESGRGKIRTSSALWAALEFARYNFPLPAVLRDLEAVAAAVAPRREPFKPMPNATPAEFARLLTRRRLLLRCDQRERARATEGRPPWTPESGRRSALNAGSKAYGRLGGSGLQITT